MRERFSQNQLIQFQVEKIFPEVFTGFLPLNGIYNDGLREPDFYFDGLFLIKKGLVDSFPDGSRRYLTLKAKPCGKLTETRIIHHLSNEDYGYFVAVVFGGLDTETPFGELRLSAYTLEPKGIESLIVLPFPLVDKNNYRNIINKRMGRNLDGLNIQFKYPQPILQWPLNNIRDINIWEDLKGIYQRLINLGYSLKVTIEI